MQPVAVSPADEDACLVAALRETMEGLARMRERRAGTEHDALAHGDCVGEKEVPLAALWTAGLSARPPHRTSKLCDRTFSSPIAMTARRNSSLAQFFRIVKRV